jgi:hypothetical protein
MEAKIGQRKDQAGPLYKASMKEALPEEVAHGLHARAADIAGDFEPAKKWVKRLTKGKKDNRQIITSVGELHGLQQEIRDAADSAFRKGNNNIGIKLKSIHREVIDQLSNQMPDTYGAARKIYADDSSVMDAMNAGRKVLTSEVDEVSSNLSKLSKGEQEAYINGAVKTIRDRLMGGKEDKNAATKMASQLVRERLRPAFPDDQSFKTFVDRLDIEDTFAESYQKIFGGSQTQPRQEAKRIAAETIAGSPVIEGGDAITIAKNAVKKSLGLDQIPPVVWDDISSLLFTPIKDIPKKDIDSLLKYGISKRNLQQIQGDISGAIGVAGTQQALQRAE